MSALVNLKHQNVYACMHFLMKTSKLSTIALVILQDFVEQYNIQYGKLHHAVCMSVYPWVVCEIFTL